MNYEEKGYEPLNSCNPFKNSETCLKYLQNLIL
jgi:hypothetical protein